MPHKLPTFIVQKQLLYEIDTRLDSHQFAYRKNKSTEDATLLLTDYICKHLELNKTYVRTLFIDYSSAFNTIIPCELIKKLLELNTSPSICLFILDFLSDRKQQVRLPEYLSPYLFTNVGAPQGCVLSALLFIVYTNNL